MYPVAFFSRILNEAERNYALSRIDDKEDTKESNEIILSLACWINAINWYLVDELKNTLPCHKPEECPTNKRYVPPRLSCSALGIIS